SIAVFVPSAAPLFIDLGSTNGRCRLVPDGGLAAEPGVCAFGSPATYAVPAASCRLDRLKARGFASPPLDGFAFVGAYRPASSPAWPGIAARSISLSRGVAKVSRVIAGLLRRSYRSVTASSGRGRVSQYCDTRPRPLLAVTER